MLLGVLDSLFNGDFLVAPVLFLQLFHRRKWLSLCRIVCLVALLHITQRYVIAPYLHIERYFAVFALAVYFTTFFLVVALFLLVITACGFIGFPIVVVLFFGCIGFSGISRAVWYVTHYLMPHSHKTLHGGKVVIVCIVSERCGGIISQYLQGFLHKV